MQCYFRGRAIVKTAEVVQFYDFGGVSKYTAIRFIIGETVMFGRKGTLSKLVYANEIFWTVGVVLGKFAFPSSAEQQRIAAFLDDKSVE